MGREGLPNANAEVQGENLAKMFSDFTSRTYLD